MGFGHASAGDGFDRPRAGHGSSRGSALNFEHVVARAASLNLTAAQVEQRRLNMVAAQIQSFDAAYGGGAQAGSAGAPAAGPRDPALVCGTGGQFVAHTSGLSGWRG
ncbi:hypothetical protein KVR01_007682 [Diaporthe batatas]|uniref:uncharacterized protein n=1 Tax=Diaporthe batatas TaxID=748121 RepID=UPI001D038CF8|nr:uncharacterized protein KVR01_007682 [Diaporthe batatas]KAG8161917.1 hypothetical protein KVR01_007682 [Diaporthe batatas]